MGKIYIFSLANPGDKYKNTRHNAGRIVMDFVYESHKDYIDNNFLYVKTDCFINESGNWIKNYLKNKKYDDFIIIYDDKDLSLGTIRKAFARGDGGHNGIKNIINHFGKDFFRIRIGINNRNNTDLNELNNVNNIDTADFVLENFKNDELRTIKSLEISKAVLARLEDIKKEILTKLK